MVLMQNKRPCIGIVCSAHYINRVHNCGPVQMNVLAVEQVRARSAAVHTRLSTKEYFWHKQTNASVR